MKWYGIFYSWVCHIFLNRFVFWFSLSTVWTSVFCHFKTKCWHLFFSSDQFAHWPHHARQNSITALESFLVNTALMCLMGYWLNLTHFVKFNPRLYRLQTMDLPRKYAPNFKLDWKCKKQDWIWFLSNLHSFLVWTKKIVNDFSRIEINSYGNFNG